MKRILCLFFICLFVVVLKITITGQQLKLEAEKNELLEQQQLILDLNKSVIAKLEYYKSATFLNTQKEKLELVELTPQNTIILPLVPDQNAQTSNTIGDLDQNETSTIYARE